MGKHKRNYVELVSMLVCMYLFIYVFIYLFNYLISSSLCWSDFTPEKCCHYFLYFLLMWLNDLIYG
jgi:hypothetical protein